MAYKLDKEEKRVIAETDKQSYVGYKIGELRKVFFKYQDKTRWKNPISAYISNREEANKFPWDSVEARELRSEAEYLEALYRMKGK
jgi:hypothetical protein